MQKKMRREKSNVNVERTRYNTCREQNCSTQVDNRRGEVKTFMRLGGI